MSTWAALGAKTVVLDAGTAANKVGLESCEVFVCTLQLRQRCHGWGGNHL